MRLKSKKVKALFEIELGAKFEDLTEDYAVLNEYLEENQDQEIWYFDYCEECKALLILIGDKKNV